MQPFDLIVIGAGPGGYVAAIRAAQLGMKVGVVEENHLGGICLNWGCIPTKALLRSAELYQQISHAADFGIKVAGAEPDIEAMVARSRQVSTRLSQGIKHLMGKNKVTVLEGRGKILAANQVSVADKLYQAEHIIIATGARARNLPGLTPDGEHIWSYREALVPKSQPKSMLVIGSGAIGIEFANFYHALGCEVTVVEIMDQILPVEDKEIADIAMNAMKQRGIKFELQTKVVNVEKGEPCKVTLEKDGKQHTIDVEKVISAVGVVPNVEDLGLGDVDVALDEKGFIQTDAQCRTSAPGIYAIGDVAGAPCLAHKASHEGILCVEAINGQHTHAMDKTNIPGCTYGFPQVASIGLTEAALKAESRAIKVGRFPLMANGKAIAMGETEGMMKVIFCEKTGELLGAHLVGAEVTEMIQGYAVGKTLETTEEQLMQTVFPHPTMSEAMHEAVLDAYQRAIHI